MQIHNTVLALQVMNGVKVYAVRFLNDNRVKTTKTETEDSDGARYFSPSFSGKRYSYKSAIALDVGTWVVVPTNDGARFGFAKVVRDVTDELDFDSDVKLLWINQTIDDPSATFEAHAARDASARRKLAASQAKQAAENHLAALGVDLSAFAISDQSTKKENDNA